MIIFGAIVLLLGLLIFGICLMKERPVLIGVAITLIGSGLVVTGILNTDDYDYSSKREIVDETIIKLDNRNAFFAKTNQSAINRDDYLLTLSDDILLGDKMNIEGTVVQKTTNSNESYLRIELKDKTQAIIAVNSSTDISTIKIGEKIKSYGTYGEMITYKGPFGHETTAPLLLNEEIA